MKMVKNLSKVNIRKFDGFERREDLDFVDDGDFFRGFSYKGMPIITHRFGDTTYLCVRVDYLENSFTYKAWMETTECSLCDKFNGVSEFDIDELIENLEAIIAKVADMNEAAENEDIDMSDVKAHIREEIKFASESVEKFKANFVWYEANGYVLEKMARYLKATIDKLEKMSTCDVDSLDNKSKKEMVERLRDYGYVAFKSNDFYISEMMEAIS